MAARILVHLFIYECIISVFIVALTAGRGCVRFILLALAHRYVVSTKQKRRGKKLFPPFSRALMAMIMIIISYDFVPLLPSMFVFNWHRSASPRYVCVAFNIIMTLIHSLTLSHTQSSNSKILFTQKNTNAHTLTHYYIASNILVLMLNIPPSYSCTHSKP